MVLQGGGDCGDATTAGETRGKQSHVSFAISLGDEGRASVGDNLFCKHCFLLPRLLTCDAVTTSIFSGPPTLASHMNGTCVCLCERVRMCVCVCVCAFPPPHLTAGAVVAVAGL